MDFSEIHVQKDSCIFKRNLCAIQYNTYFHAVVYKSGKAVSPLKVISFLVCFKHSSLFRKRTSHMWSCFYCHSHFKDEEIKGYGGFENYTRHAVLYCLPLTHLLIADHCGLLKMTVLLLKPLPSCSSFIHSLIPCIECLLCTRMSSYSGQCLLICLSHHLMVQL